MLLKIHRFLCAFSPHPCTPCLSLSTSGISLVIVVWRNMMQSEAGTPLQQLRLAWGALWWGTNTLQLALHTLSKISKDTGKFREASYCGDADNLQTDHAPLFSGEQLLWSVGTRQSGTRQDQEDTSSVLTVSPFFFSFFPFPLSLFFFVLCFYSSSVPRVKKPK